MAHIHRLICLLLVVFPSMGVHAFPSSPQYYITPPNGPQLGPFGAPADACEPWFSWMSANTEGWAGNPSRIYMGYAAGSGAVVGYCRAGNGTSPFFTTPVSMVVGCPANSTGVGSDECECNAGYTEEAGQCKPDEPPDTPDDYCARQSFSWNAWSTTQDRTGIVEDARTLPMDQPSIVCMPVSGGGAGSPPGCKHEFTPQLRYRMSDTDPWRYEGDSWALGPNDKDKAGGTLACVPGLDDLPKREDPKPGCEGGIPGQVNGVDVCIDPASGHTEGVDWTRVTDSDGNVKEQKTTVKCDGEKCTVTTTTKTPGDPGEGTTTTTTTTRGAYCAKNPASSICAGAVDPTGSSRNQNGRGGPGDPASRGNGGGNGGGNGEGNGFCKENPDSPICKQSSFSGSCAASFVCDGDAIQCAIAKEQHIRACKLFDDPSPESQLYEANKGKEGNQTGELPGNETVNIAGRIDMSNALGAGSCVSDRTVTVWGQSVTLPFSAICPSLAMFGQLLVAVSLLLAARIVMRG